MEMGQSCQMTDRNGPVTDGNGSVLSNDRNGPVTDGNGSVLSNDRNGPVTDGNGSVLSNDRWKWASLIKQLMKIGQ